jgi:Domain of unknown function (DUF4129)
MPRRELRVATVAVLLAVTVVGLRTRGAFASKPDAAAAGATGAVLATALIACEGVALAAFIVLLVAARSQRRPRKEDEPERLVVPWWAKSIAVLLAVALLATPPVVLLTRPTRPARKHPFVPPLGHLVNPVSGARPPGAAASSSAWPLIVGMAIAIAVVLTLTLVVRRWRLPGPPRHLDRPAALAESLAAGSAALAANDDPRTAIIACYAAMEQGFAAAGSAPAAADTPAEVLTRALSAGIVEFTGSAETLTGLFRHARYSSDPMTPADARAAATALTELRARVGAGR